MRKTLITLLVLMLAVGLSAQPTRKRDEAVAIGVRMGGNLASYNYSSTAELNALSFDTLLKRVRPIVGLNVEIPLLDGIVYVAPEVELAGRGDARTFHSEVWGADVCYQAKTFYLEARLPIAVAIPVTSWLKPYFFAAPVFGLTMPLGGISQYSLDDPQSFDQSVTIDSSNMAPYDYGVLAGGGLRFTFGFSRFSLVVKMEAGYHIGFMDTFSEAEHTDQAQALNVNAYNINETRRNRGIEAAITVALPLRFAPGDACSNWHGKNF